MRMWTLDAIITEPKLVRSLCWHIKNCWEINTIMAGVHQHDLRASVMKIG